MVFVDYEMCDSLSPLSLFLSWCTYLCKAIQLIVKLVTIWSLWRFLLQYKSAVLPVCVWRIHQRFWIIGFATIYLILKMPCLMNASAPCASLVFSQWNIFFFKAIKKTRNVFLIKSQAHLAWLYNLEVIPQLLCIMNTLWC